MTILIFLPPFLKGHLQIAADQMEMKKLDEIHKKIPESVFQMKVAKNDYYSHLFFFS